VISSRAAGSTRSLSSITGGVSLAPTTGGATAGWLGGDCGSGAGRDSSAFGGLSVANTGDAGWLLLATAVALSGKVGRGVGACGAFSAATLLAKGGDGATDAWSLPLAAVSPIGADCGAARAGLLSAAISLIGANCGAAGARLPLPATVPPADAICEPKGCRRDLCWNLIGGLRLDEDTWSGSEVNRLIGEFLGQALPSIDFAHGDLT
jgi:hypothetical protein